VFLKKIEKPLLMQSLQRQRLKPVLMLKKKSTKSNPKVLPVVHLSNKPRAQTLLVQVSLND
jgi:hypothetical protein